MYQFTPLHNNYFNQSFFLPLQQYPQYQLPQLSYYSHPFNYNYNYPQYPYNGWMNYQSQSDSNQLQTQQQRKSKIKSHKPTIISLDDNFLEKTKQIRIINREKEKKEIKPKPKSKLSTESLSPSELKSDKSNSHKSKQISLSEHEDRFVPSLKEKPNIRIFSSTSKFIQKSNKKKNEKIIKSISSPNKELKKSLETSVKEKPVIEESVKDERVKEEPLIEEPAIEKIKLEKLEIEGIKQIIENLSENKEEQQKATETQISNI